MTEDKTLASLLDRVRQFPGIAHKEDIARWVPQLPLLPEGWHPNGDDAAAIPTSDGYSLLAMEGFLNDFVESDPWFAGWCGVMVNISDIAAMGGEPVAVVNALWSHQHDKGQQMMDGMAAAAKAFNVPIVGGHSNLRSRNSQLAVAILGRAQRLLSAFEARAGQILVTAIDHRGAFRAPYLHWNAATDAPPDRLRGDIALLPDIANAGLAFAAKDISQAGLLGTTLMLMESSRVGAEVNLDRLPKPDGVSWPDWLCAFPSFGYLLTTSAEALPKLLASFEQRGISAAAIGTINGSQQLTVSLGSERELFRDLKDYPLTGLSPRPTYPSEKEY